MHLRKSLVSAVWFLFKKQVDNLFLSCHLWATVFRESRRCFVTWSIKLSLTLVTVRRAYCPHLKCYNVANFTGVKNFSLIMELGNCQKKREQTGRMFLICTYKIINVNNHSSFSLLQFSLYGELWRVLFLRCVQNWLWAEIVRLC